MANNMLPRICRGCGREFLGGPRAWYCPDCRKERAREADRKMKRRKKNSDYIPLGSVIKCELCGKDIIKNGGLQKYCVDCAIKHLKDVDNAQSLEWKRNNPEKIREAKRKYEKLHRAKK